MKKIIGFISLLILCFQVTFAAQPSKRFKGRVDAPVPSTCVTGVFTKTGDDYWSQYQIKVTNNCGKDVDFQNSSFTFTSNTNLSTSFWGDFSPLSYPDNLLSITSQATSSAYTSSFQLHFPEESWANSVLHDKESFTVKYSVSSQHAPSALKVYINGDTPPVTTGNIAITNSTAKPAKVSQTYALVNLTLNGQTIKTVQVPWAGSLSVTELTPGTYTLGPQSVTDSDQNTFEGKANPSTVTVTAGNTVNSTISYTQVVVPGSIKVSAPVKPSSLASYTGTPVVTFKRTDTGASVVSTIPWNAVTTQAGLDNNVSYQMSTPTIVSGGTSCVGSFNPATLVSSATNPSTTQLSYTCTTVTQDKITLSVSGLPCDTSSIVVSFKPSDGSSTVTQTVTISSGSGTGTVTLTDGVVYNVSATTVTGYLASFSLQPLMAKPSLTETITYTPVPKK